MSCIHPGVLLPKSTEFEARKKGSFLRHARCAINTGWPYLGTIRNPMRSNRPKLFAGCEGPGQGYLI